MGDMMVEIRYTDYRDVGNGAKFPYRIHGHQGDHPPPARLVITGLTCGSATPR